MTDTLTIHPGGNLSGSTTVPGDKSISHRALMLGALADGTSQIRGWLPAGDTYATLNALRALGTQIDQHSPTALTIHDGALQPPTAPLNLVNAGTGLRLLAGILAGQNFSSVLDGSDQLRRRPMRRITEPLRLMGADVSDTGGFPPISFRPAQLHGITYTLPVASAQVKSALLLAGLFADGPTTVVEPGPARDHTERMLASMGADLRVEGNMVTLTPGRALQPLELTIPGDFSSAAFLMVAASLLADSAITLEHISLNPTRTGLLDALLAMGAAIDVTSAGTAGGDPVGQLRVRSSALRGASISGAQVVRMIDELPALMIAALQASGETRVRDARELRVKETDRIAVMTAELRKMGADITEFEDGFSITGPQRLTGAKVEAHDDHRIAMSLAVAALNADGPTTIRGASCTADSFPGFAETLRALGAHIL